MEILALRCPWYVAGPLLGLLITALLWATNKPLGALGGYCDTVTWLQARARGPSWRVFLLLGIVIGGALSSMAAGTWQPTFAYGSFDAVIGSTPAVKALTLFAAGGLIGYGARMAGGCTSGHGMCGTAMGSPASLVATATFMGTAVITTHGLAWLPGVGP